MKECICVEYVKMGSGMKFALMIISLASPMEIQSFQEVKEMNYGSLFLRKPMQNYMDLIRTLLEEFLMKQ